MFTTPIDAARHYHSSAAKKYVIKSSDLNGVTAVDKNTFRYNCGTVEFKDNVPFNVKKTFLKNGTGNILKKYFTEVSFDAAKNEVTISAVKIPNIIKFFKLIAGEKIKPIVHTFEYNNTPTQIYKNFIHFIGMIK